MAVFKGDGLAREGLNEDLHSIVWMGSEIGRGSYFASLVVTVR